MGHYPGGCKLLVLQVIHSGTGDVGGIVLSAEIGQDVYLAIDMRSM